MLRFLFPRVFGQFKENALIRGAFVFETDDDSWSRYTTDGHSYGGTDDLTVADAGTGLVDVTFPKCKSIEVLSATIRNTSPGTFGNIRQVELPHMTKAIAQAGTFQLAIYAEDGTSGVPALADPADGALLSLALWIER